MVLFKGKRCVVVVLVVLTLVVLCASHTVAKEEDPELQQCKHQCKQQRQFDSKQKRECEKSCEDYIKEKEKREERDRSSRRHGPEWEYKEKERGEREGNSVGPWRRGDVSEKEYRECRKRCQEDEGEWKRGQQLCESECEQRRKSYEIGGKREESEQYGSDEEEEEEEIGGKSGKPYVFEDHHFDTKKLQEGKVKVLKRFTKRSKLFKGIENYRVEIFQANPQTFLVPNHWDADTVFFVCQGEGALSLLYPDKRESFNIERGHVVIIPAGVPTYLINKGNNEKLVLVHLIRPISTPGKFEEFFGPGSENKGSFFEAFSSEILGAAYKASGDKVKRIFSPQREGFIVKASEEQIKALTHHSLWPFGGKGSRGAGSFQLLKQHPKEANEFGKLFEMDLNDYTQLVDLNIAVTFANITQGSMHTPFYNTRATKIAVVLKGRGYFEMACPHVSKSDRKHKHHQGGSTKYDKDGTSPINYKKINSELKQGTVFIVPPGHPFVTLASEDENLEVICFEINALHSYRIPLAGKKNIWRNLEKEAKELSFGTSVEEIDRLFESEDEFFLAGPRRRERRQGFAII